MKTIILVRCDRSGPAGRHRWRQEICDRFKDGTPIWDRRCRRCHRWYIDVIELVES